MKVTTYGTLGTELASLHLTKYYRPGVKRGVILCHGLNGKGWHPVNFPDPVVEEMTNRGHPVLCPDLGGPATWGNDAAQTKIADAITYLQGTIGAKSGGVLLWCGSMGTLAGLNFMRNNPSAVTALADGLPAVDLADLHDNPVPRGIVNNTSIETAYGGAAGYSAARAAHNPIENTAEYQPLANRIRLWYSVDDPTTIPGRVQAFADATGVAITSMGSGPGHTFKAAYAGQVADWLESFG